MKFEHIFNKILAPFYKSFVHFVWFFILLIVPSVVYWLKMPLDFLHIKYVILAIPICLWSSYLCCCFSNCKYGGYYIKRIIYILLTTFAVIECFLLTFFGTRITEMTLQLLFETNGSETAGFFQIYIFTRKFLLYLFIVILVLIINIITVKLLKDYRPTKKIRFFCIPMLLLCCVLNLWRDTRFVKQMIRPDIQSILIDIDGTIYSKNYTTIGRLIYSSRIYFLLSSDINRLEETLSMNTIIKSNYKSPKIVVIIGESFNKYHSNLYGYELITNPYLTDEYNNGNLYVFEDVCTPFNVTHRCLKSLLSFESQDNNIYWVSDLLFPALFKKAGYHVNFISNQEVKGGNKDSWSFSNDYLTNPKNSQYLFDYMNQVKYQFDYDLVYNTKEQIDTSIDNFLSIYHLMGQHAAYAYRYPSEYNKFTVADYYYRKDLNNDSKMIVASYDNATLYNDAVVKNILDIYRNDEVIAIYFSDHGEEVYDFRNRVGRCHDEIIIPQRAKYEYSIPFMVWMSDGYKAAHPNIVEAVSAAVNNPFMIDDLPHLLIDLSGIDYETFDPSRSPINFCYNKSRKRYLEMDKQCYEKILMEK